MTMTTLSSAGINLGAAIFSLEAGEWSVSEVTSKRKLQFANENVVNCGGVLYWLNGARWWAPEHGVVAFDPFGDTKQCRHIDVPAGLTDK